MDPRPSFRRLSKAKRYALGSALLLIATIVFRHALTSSMALHMIAHIPGILVAGVLAGYALLARFDAPEKEPSRVGLAPLSKVQWVRRSGPFAGHASGRVLDDSQGARSSACLGARRCVEVCRLVRCWGDSGGFPETIQHCD